jgi:hypothetical protein
VSAQSLTALATVDAAVFLPVTVIVAIVALWRRRRPVTRARAMEVALASILLVMMSARYAALAVATAAAPAAVLGPGVPTVAQGLTAGVFAAVALLGLVAYRGGVGWRVAGALVFAAIAVAETVANGLILEASLATRADTALSVLLAGATVILAAFYWTRRTATPDPLGPRGRPFDY